MKEMKVSTFVGTIVLFMIIEAIMVISLAPKSEKLEYSEEMCKQAVCNEEKTMCYVYGIDKEGITKVAWKGTCKK